MENILKYRAHIMALAILLVCYHHAVDGNVVAWCGYIAVDVFFFVSGVGLLHSMRKNAALWGFWKRRIARLLPTILIFLLAGTLINLLLPWGGVDLFFADEAEICRLFRLELPTPHWYIVAIIIFYLIFPFFYYTAEKRGYLFSLIVFSLAAHLVTIALQWSGNYQCNMITLRLPVGFLGAYMYQRYLEGKGYPVGIRVAAYLVSLVSLAVICWVYFGHDNPGVFWRNGLKYYPMFALGTCLTYAFARLVAWVPQNAWGKRVLALLSFIGALTLEIYLCDGVHAIRQLAVRGAGSVCLKIGHESFCDMLGLALRLMVYILVAYSISLVAKYISKSFVR